ncbi:hypothetical protein NF212_00740 [Parasalinivibrio latis]|uniref:hypothetical protein n=1 Tax=Parasalinivibrio latis TaxID=2952610 RepID=UPI0030E4A4E9
MNKVRPEPAESQVLRLLNQFEQSLSDGDWDTLASLDNRLQRAIPALHQQAMTPALRQALEQLNAFYGRMLDAGQQEKSRIQKQLSKQEANREQVMAYLDHSE